MGGERVFWRSGMTALFHAPIFLRISESARSGSSKRQAAAGHCPTAPPTAAFQASSNPASSASTIISLPKSPFFRLSLTTSTASIRTSRDGLTNPSADGPDLWKASITVAPKIPVRRRQHEMVPLTASSSDPPSEFLLMTPTSSFLSRTSCSARHLTLFGGIAN